MPKHVSLNLESVLKDKTPQELEMQPRYRKLARMQGLSLSQAPEEQRDSTRQATGGRKYLQIIPFYIHTSQSISVQHAPTVLTA